MAAHTPGPWEAKRLDAAHLIIQSAERGTVARTTVPINATKAEIYANALALAAVPELIVALRDLLMCIEVDDLIPQSVSYMRQAHAALIKAGDSALRRP